MEGVISKPKSRAIEKKYMNCVEFSRMLGTSPQTVQKLCTDRVIPHLRLLNRSILIDPEEAIAFLRVEPVDRTLNGREIIIAKDGKL